MSHFATLDVVNTCANGISHLYFQIAWHRVRCSEPSWKALRGDRTAVGRRPTVRCPSFDLGGRSAFGKVDLWMATANAARTTIPYLCPIMFGIEIFCARPKVMSSGWTLFQASWSNFSAAIRHAGRPHSECHVAL